MDRRPAQRSFRIAALLTCGYRPSRVGLSSRRYVRYRRPLLCVGFVVSGVSTGRRHSQPHRRRKLRRPRSRDGWRCSRTHPPRSLRRAFYNGGRQRGRQYRRWRGGHTYGRRAVLHMEWPVAALANVLAGRQRCRLLWRQQSRQTYHWRRVMAGTRKALARRFWSRDGWRCSQTHPQRLRWRTFLWRGIVVGSIDGGEAGACMDGAPRSTWSGRWRHWRTGRQGSRAVIRIGGSGLVRLSNVGGPLRALAKR